MVHKMREIFLSGNPAIASNMVNSLIHHDHQALQDSLLLLLDRLPYYQDLDFKALGKYVFIFITDVVS